MSLATGLDTAEFLHVQIIGYAAYGAALSDGGSFMPFFQVLELLSMPVIRDYEYVMRGMSGCPAVQATLPSSTSPIPKWALILVNVVSTCEYL